MEFDAVGKLIAGRCAAGAGLSAALVDVTDPEFMKVAYLIKTFRDEITFAAGDLA